MRLRPPERARAERRVHLQAVVRHERVEVAARVRDEPELDALRAQLLQHRRRVLEQLEVLGVLPGPRHLDRALVGAVGVAAHAADDPLGEGDPDLLVVLELWVALDPLHRPLARLAVARGIELEAEALAQTAIALGTELRPRARDREVDVEEDCLQHHDASSSQRAVSTCVCRCSPSNAQAMVWPIVQPRARSRSRPSSDDEPVEAVEHVAYASGRARASGRSARPRTRARRPAASGRSRATARAVPPARCRRAGPGAAAPARPACAEARSAPRAPRPAAGARTDGRTAPRSRPASRSTTPPRRRASRTARRPASRAAAAARRTRPARPLPPTSESGVPGTQRSSSSACSSGSKSSSRIAPSPSQSSSAAASCSLSRCGCWIFSTACSPSAVVTGATSSEAKPPANGSPRVSPRREIRRSPASGTRRPGGSSATAASRAPSAAAHGRARP